MKPSYLLLPPVFFLSLLVGGCGGGGGGSAGDSSLYPNSGTYSWVLKATGSTTSSRKGLSLVHPSHADTEYVIEPPRDVLSDARLVSRGSVEAGAQRASGVQSEALLYIIGGDVRLVPLTADGTSPLSRVQRAQSTSACAVVIAANDHATPLNSRFVVSTAGPDGQCDTADDGRAEVRLTASGPLIYTVLSGDAPLGFVRDTATMAPRGWLQPGSVLLWATPTAPLSTRAAPAAPITAVLGSAPNASLVSDGTRLSVFNFSASGVTEVLLDAATTSGTSWQPIGFDAANFYVYDNPGANVASGWRILRVSRVNPAATVLASGTGQVVFASMGQDMLYLSAYGATENQTVRLSKAGGAPAITRTPTSELVTISTCAGNVHQRFRARGLDTTSPIFSVEMVDETDVALFGVAGGLPVAISEASVLNYNASESRTQFILASNFGSSSFADATLIAYDTVARVSRSLGKLPGSAEYGSDDVFAQVISGPASVGAGYAARVTTGSVQATGSKVFIFDPATAGSLKFTTRTE